MDPFGGDDLFDIFGGAHSIVAEPTTAPISQKRKADLPEHEDKRSKAKHESNIPIIEEDVVEIITPSAAGAEPLNTKIVRSQGGKLSDDYFAQYKDQVVVGSAKPIKASTAEEKTCAMQTCYPPDYDENDPINQPPPRPTEPAKTYPFVLDPFQAKSIDCIERNESVLVSAHTSAGKTVVAEYAIALSLKLGQRVIYTSPIKALSNQKFRELQEEFHDVGLMTGDITINPSASCLVMTTEILRNMLYRGSEVMREVAWVVFDEIHYMRDRARGVVWEETIILLPPKVRMVFLSATIPNAAEFALWVAKVHARPCSVVYTDYRPTPLQHFVFPTGGKGLYPVLEGNGQFNELSYGAALAVLNAGSIAGSGNSESKDGGVPGEEVKKKKATKSSGKDVAKIVKLVMEKGLDPCIVFSFSKKDCEKFAGELKHDFCSEDEKQLISQIFSNAIEALTVEDKKLPQVQNILPLIRRGIGVHHGGLLPILKEVIEILFQEGLLKVLFSTETFAMGLNMPARTVVFTSVKKFDGVNFRLISSGEYIQMSGRAGRRGLDDRGIVIMMLSDSMEPPIAKQMITGAADPLHSSFHLGYNMLLNLLRVEGADPEYIMTRSFYQFQQQRAVPKLQLAIDTLESQANAIDIPREKEIAQYYALTKELQHLLYQERQIVSTADHSGKFFKSGRIIKISGILRRLASGDGRIIGEESVSQRLCTIQGVELDDDVKKALQEVADLPTLTNTNPTNISTQDLLANESASTTDSKNKSEGYTQEFDWGYGIIIKYEKKTMPPSVLHGVYENVHPFMKDATAITGTRHSASANIITALIAVEPSSLPEDFDPTRPTTTIYPQTLRPYVYGTKTSNDEPPRYILISLLPSAVDFTCQQCLRAETKITDLESLEHASLGLREVIRRNVATHLARDNYQIVDAEYSNLVSRILRVEGNLQNHAIAKWDGRELALAGYSNRLSLLDHAKILNQRLLTVSQDIGLRQTLHCMKRVLRTLALTDDSDIIMSKGRVACEVSTCDELVATELIYTGVFNDLNEAQVCALCSCLVFDEPHEDPKNAPSEELAAPHRQMVELAKKIATTIEDSRLPIDKKKYVDALNPFLMEVVRSWCDGSKFADIMKMTDCFEGTIIRVMRRLEELLRQFALASKAIGNEVLEAKFIASGRKLKRDIVFAASLYL